MKTISLSNLTALALVIFCGLSVQGCSEKPVSPDFSEREWLAMTTIFCTTNSEREVWQTRDRDKLALLQGSLTVQSPQFIDHIIKSHNHVIEIELAADQGLERWRLVINRDQGHVSFYQLENPTRSFTADSDAMFYRALNTLLKSHMSESLDIFRKCEMSD
ncbi:hypothetical protein QWY82_14725 [Simiduia curdlanivorans]|uniref:Lipoprotein n=1 Tax=Simiduia curdlanivorans TaxID=1492769 RepID=A0ABV8V3L3_9GAMM|nr:hypothetical protein [Simiduia curdlanivorans]MDN3640052.1 hypothetical protein [Simiduia curdlanivorans]